MYVDDLLYFLHAVLIFKCMLYVYAHMLSILDCDLTFNAIKSNNN